MRGCERTAAGNFKNLPVHKTHVSTKQILIGKVEVVQGYASATVSEFFQIFQ
jgi:hypothetical protein